MSSSSALEWTGRDDALAFGRLLLSEPESVIELRALHVGRVRTVSGYFDDAEKLADFAATLDGRAEGVYVTLNPALPALLARANNRLVYGPKHTTGDNEIVARRVLLLDADPVRPSGISSTDLEKQAALNLLLAVETYLAGQGWPAPVRGDSGNGYHLVYLVDLPPEDGGLVRRVLQALAFRFDTDTARIDQGVHNPARICKLYGTLARKGENLPDRPHRRSRIIEFPEQNLPVSRGLLERVAEHAPVPSVQARSWRSGAGWDVEQYLTTHGVEVETSGQWQGGHRWVLRTCPWNSDHTDRSAYVVQLPNGAIAAGCKHNSCSGRRWQDLRAVVEGRTTLHRQADYRSTGAELLLGTAADPEPEAGRPHDPDQMSRRGRNSRARPEGLEAGGATNDGKVQIQIVGGQLPAMVDLAETALLASQGDPLFQQKDQVVRVIRLNAKARQDGIERQAGALIVRPVEPVYLVERMTKAATFVKLDSRSGEWVEKDCPKLVAETYLARISNWRLPVLAGVVRAPTLRADGSVINEPGYDQRTGIYLDPAGLVRVPLNEHPTKDHAVAARRILEEPFRSFPFIAESDRATQLSAVLTGLSRKLVRTAPFHLFRAPMRGSGKTLIADGTSLVITGVGATIVTPGEDEKETAKRVLAILVDGDEVVCFDNIVGSFESTCLCAVLTADEFKGRLLGQTKNVHASTKITWLGTGNNVTVVGDLTRRVLPCDFDPQCEHPEQRRFDGDLREEILARRPELVAAGLTLLRAYIIADRPDQKLSPYGGFEEWSDLVRSAIVWAGGADACEGRARLREVDPERAVIRAVLLAWRDTVGLGAITAKDALELARRSPAKPLLAALNEIPKGRERELDPRRLGDWISHRQGVVESGLRLVRAGDRQGAALWQLAQTRGSRGFGGTSSTLREESVGVTVSSRQAPTVPRNPPDPPAGESAPPLQAGDGVRRDRADLEPGEGEL